MVCGENVHSNGVNWKSWNISICYIVVRAQKAVARYQNTQSSSSNSRISNDALKLLISFP